MTKNHQPDYLKDTLCFPHLFVAEATHPPATPRSASSDSLGGPRHVLFGTWKWWISHPVWRISWWTRWTSIMFDIIWLSLVAYYQSNVISYLFRKPKSPRQDHHKCWSSKFWVVLRLSLRVIPWCGMKKPQVTDDHFREYMCSFNSLFAIWGVHPSGLDLIPFNSKKYKKLKFISDCGITKRQ